MRLRIAVVLLVFAAAMSAQSFSDLMQTMRSYQEGRLLMTAIELDVFTAVGDGATAAEVAERIEAHPRSTETFLNALVAIGALTKKKDVYRNTPDTARYLTAGSPDNQRPALMHTVNSWKAWTALAGAVRAGTAVSRPGVEAEDPRWTESFIAAMHSNARSAAGELVHAVGTAGVRRLLDVGGGSGAYSIAFAEANPELRAEVLDLAPVVRIARKHIAEAGVADRVTTRVGDLTKDDFGRNYNLILLSAICHMLGPEENQDLLRRCHKALAPGGRLVIRDFILEHGKTAPKHAALFAVHMLVNTRSGSTYTEREYREWLKGAGFSRTTRPDPSGDLLIAFK